MRVVIPPNSFIKVPIYAYAGAEEGVGTSSLYRALRPPSCCSSSARSSFTALSSFVFNNKYTCVTRKEEGGEIRELEHTWT